jgi:hypothetical protein
LRSRGCPSRVSPASLVVLASLIVGCGAAEAPRAVDLLASVTADSSSKTSLSAARARDYSPESPWFASQRSRLAPVHDGDALRKALAQLLDPPSRLGSPPPRGTEAMRAELGRRASQMTDQCARSLTSEKGGHPGSHRHEGPAPTRPGARGQSGRHGLPLDGRAGQLPECWAGEGRLHTLR